MNRLRLTGRLTVDGAFGVGDLLVDAAQGAPGSVVAVLVVDDPIRDLAGLFCAGGWPGLGDDLTVGDLLTGVFVAPPSEQVGHERDLGAQDERQRRGLQGDLIGLRDHPGIGDHGRVGDDFGGGGFVAREPVYRDDLHGPGEGRRVERPATTPARSLNDRAPGQAGAPGCCDRGRGQVDDEGDESGRSAAPGRPAVVVTADHPPKVLIRSDSAGATYGFAAACRTRARGFLWGR
jgi:hypothetical protein